MPRDSVSSKHEARAKRIAHAVLLAVLRLSPAVGAAAPRPADATLAFYATYRDTKMAGLPSPTQLRRFLPVISTALAKDLRAASAAEARHFKATKNEEPPLWEGDVFTSLFEGAQRANIVQCTIDGDRAQCDVALEYREREGAIDQQWQDQALLVRERDRWVVDDIRYGGTWDFGPKGTLRANLREIASYGP
ncbi:MAG TPA: DUF3828 domain-containing protein [Casimicrobiaceae bacterium]|jgi:hypothetical protein